MKVGDRVKVLSFGEQPRVVGMEGTVTSVNESQTWPIGVDIDERVLSNGVRYIYPHSCFAEGELEVIS